MIRSLVIIPNSQPLTAVTGKDATGDASTLRRNLSRESLETSLAEGHTLWIDVITPEDEEIHWLEGLLQLSPTVVSDLLREDRRPTLLVYPGYLFLSLFQPHSKSATEDRISLTEDVGDLDKLPQFEETHYISVDDGESHTTADPIGTASALFWYPPMMGWMGYPGGVGYTSPPPYRTETD